MNKLAQRMTRGLLSWLRREHSAHPKAPQDEDCPADLRKAIWEEIDCVRRGLPSIAPSPDPLPKGLRLIIRIEIYRQLGLTLPDPEATLAPVPQRMLNLIRKTIQTCLQEPVAPDSLPGGHNPPPTQPA
jgi:hypothetical protein